MDSSIAVQLIILLVLLALSAFFSSAETALVGCNRIRIKTLAEEGNRKALILEKIFSQESKMLSAILIGNNLVNTFMASIASMIAYTFGGYAVSIATFIITFLILVFGEITPKTLATRSAESIALGYAPVIYFLMKILTPVIWFINLFSSLILKLFGVKTDSQNSGMTESEIRTILDMSHEEGMIEEDEKEMINNVFDFTDAKAKDVMIPRVHVVMANADSKYDDLISLFQQEQFTRIPIYKDNVDNIIGFVNMKDMLLLKDKNDFNINQILRKPYFTVENKSVSELLGEMQKNLCNIALVLDEYGELSGIITIEDIIEEIVGNLHDEYDEHEMENIKKIDDRTYHIKGYLSLHDINDALDLDLNSEDFDSIGGLLIDELGRLPSYEDKIVLPEGIELKVLKLSGNRIEEIEMVLPAKEEQKTIQD